MSNHSIIVSIFLASVHSVGKVSTLTLAGVYLQQRGFILGDGKRTLALISQQLMTPCFLFTKIVSCSQNGSTDKCPSVTDSLKDIWLLMLWPIYVVGCGLLVGHLIAKITSSPPQHRPVVLAACAFPNFIGVPIVLLEVIRADFPSKTELGATEPTAFLSILLIFFPMLQWGLGGFLLTPKEEHTFGSGVKGHTCGIFDDNVEKPDDRIDNYITHNVLNNTRVPDLYKYAHKGIQDTDASLYLSNSNLAGLDPQVILVDEDNEHNLVIKTSSAMRLQKRLPLSTITEVDEETVLNQTAPLVAKTDLPCISFMEDENQHHISLFSSKSIAPKSYHMDQYATIINTIGKILERCFQPPVIGALMGMFVVSIPTLRGVLVDTVTRKNNAPLQWFFDGLHLLGQAAIPINMTILGASLLPINKKRSDDTMHEGDLSKESLFGIVIGKMVIMPIIGVISCSILRKFILSIPEGMQPPVFLAISIPFFN